MNLLLDLQISDTFCLNLMQDGMKMPLGKQVKQRLDTKK